jgi:phosphoglycerate dehydrogenase-like enzyme
MLRRLLVVPAITELLRRCQLGGAALDVFAVDPWQRDHPMLELLE